MDIALRRLIERWEAAATAERERADIYLDAGNHRMSLLLFAYADSNANHATELRDLLDEFLPTRPTVGRS